MSGPAIYLADDVNKIAKFCIQQANIPDKMMETMKIALEFNDKVNKEIEKNTTNIETLMEKYGDKTESALRDPMLKRYKNKIEDLKISIKSINLNDVYIPNRKAHLNKWASDFEDEHQYAFTCDIGMTIFQKLCF